MGIENVDTGNVSYKIDIPETARVFPGDPRQVVMRPYTLGQELQATKVARAGGDLDVELLRHSVTEIDGKPAADKEWPERTSAKVRNLLIRAQVRINMPSEGELEGFLAQLSPSAG